MCDSPLVSVIVPAYNVEKYIKKCITSIIRQSYKKIEIIIINDGSDDTTSDIIRLLSSLDNRINVVNQANLGVSAARNMGIKIAKGDYICFVDADDFLEKDFVSYMLNLITLDESDFAYSTREYRDSNDKQDTDSVTKTISSNESTAILLSPDTTVGCWNKIYRSSFLRKSKLSFNEKLFYGEGLQFIIDASVKANKITIGNRKVYHYRRNNPSSATTKFDICKIVNGKKSLVKIGKKINLSDSEVRNMYNLHVATFDIGAIVKIRSNKKQREYKTIYSECKKEARKLTKGLLLERIPLKRKLLLLVATLSPKFLTSLDRKRNERRLKSSE